MRWLIRFEKDISISRLEYVLEVLNEHPFCPPELSFSTRNSGDDVARSIFYGPAGLSRPGEWVIPAQRMIFGKKAIRPLKPVANIYPFAGHSLYSVEFSKREEKNVFMADRRFGFDLFEAIFFHLSRYEEFYAAPEDLDEWDMLNADRHFLVSNDLHHQPVVDRLIYAFFTALGYSLPLPLTRVVMTHDVDAFFKFPSIYKFVRSAGRLATTGLFSRLPALAGSFLKTRLFSSPDPFDTFDWLLSERGGTEKIVYFLSGGSTRYDRYVQIGHPYARKVIAMAKDRGYQIGLHPSYATWKDPALFREERSRLETLAGEPVRLSRQHFLHFSFKDTPAILEGAEIEQDSSLGFQDRIGFRCGTGFPFRFYDLKREWICSFRELPLVAMDSAIVSEAKLKGMPAEIFLEEFLKKNDTGTRITANFHNSSFDDIRWPATEMRRLFDKINGDADGC